MLCSYVGITDDGSLRPCVRDADERAQGLCKPHYVIKEWACDMKYNEDGELRRDHDLARNIVWRMLRKGKLNDPETGRLPDGLAPDDCFPAAYQGMYKGAEHIDLSKSRGEQITFLITCIKNKVIDFLRAEGTYRGTFETGHYHKDGDNGDDINDGLDVDDGLSAKVVTKVAALSNWKDVLVQTTLKSMISRMPEQYQRVFEMKFNDPMVTAEEIGLALDIPVKTVESLLRRGRKLLKQEARR